MSSDTLNQLPEGMEHCTILFKECELGHGRLLATNWIDHGCLWCKIKELEASRSEIKLLNDVLPSAAKYAIADKITIENRSKSDVVQDVWDGFVSRGLVREPKREISCTKCDAEMLRVKMCEHIAEGEEGWNTPENRNICPSTMAVAELRDSYEHLQKLVNTPELIDFPKAVHVEAIHQRERWGEDHDKRKEAPDWFWLIGYVAGKALSAWKTGDTEKLRHHHHHHSCCVQQLARSVNQY